MADSNITKKAFADAMKKLMQEKTFQKISVSDIAKAKKASATTAIIIVVNALFILFSISPQRYNFSVKTTTTADKFR